MSEIPKELQIIVGKCAWRVWKGVGSFLLFEFGRPRVGGDGSKSGTYTLWIYMADWHMRDSRRELAHSESPDADIHRAADAFTGNKLESIVLRTVVLQRKLRYGAMFYFEGDLRLQATMYERSKDDPIFMLYSPTLWVSYNSNGKIVSKAAER